jgi:hypothetical protein
MERQMGVSDHQPALGMRHKIKHQASHGERYRMQLGSLQNEHTSEPGRCKRRTNSNGREPRVAAGRLVEGIEALLNACPAVDSTTSLASPLSKSR